MEDIKLFAKSEKKSHKNIQPGYRNGIYNKKLRHTGNEKRKKDK